MLAKSTLLCYNNYSDKERVIICVLKGSIFFTCELAKRLDMPVTIDVMQVSSYGSETVSSGVINIKKELDESIEGKNAIIIEDIISFKSNSLLKINLISYFI